MGGRYGVVRERIRQIEAKAIECVRTNAPFPEGLFGPDPGRLLAAYRAAPAVVGRVRAAIRLAAATLDLKVRIRTSGERIAVGAAARVTELKETLRKLFAAPVYRLASDVEQELGLEPGALRGALDFESKLELAGEQVGWRWSKRDRLLAVARLAARHGVMEWHVSQMAKALAVVDPAGCGRLTGRLVIAIVTRKEDTAFSTTGRRGEWLLSENGDGFRTTLEAVRQVLEESDCPLHLSDVHRMLRRDIPEANVVALLHNASHFQAFGRNVYGLAGRQYARDGATLAWILEQLGAERSISLDVLSRRAEDAGIRPETLRGTAQASEVLSYIPSRFGARIERME